MVTNNLHGSDFEKTSKSRRFLKRSFFNNKIPQLTKLIYTYLANPQKNNSKKYNKNLMLKNITSQDKLVSPYQFIS